MAIPTTGQFTVEKGKKGSVGYKPVYLVEVIGKDLYYATREPGFTGNWKYGDGLIYGSTTEYGDAYPTYDTGIHRLDAGGIDTISYSLDSLGLARTGNCGIDLLNQELLSKTVGEMVGAYVRIRMGFYGGTFDDFITIFAGNIDDFKANYEHLALDLVDDTVKNVTSIPPLTGADFLPRSQTLGQAIPIILGDVDGVPAFTLISDVSAYTGTQFLNTDTSLFVQGTNHAFPSAGDLTITSGATTETLSYGVIRPAVTFNTPMLEFTDLTRTSSATFPATSLVELDNFKYTYVPGFSGQDIRNVRANGSHPSNSPEFYTQPVDPNGNDHRRIHTVQFDGASEDGVTLSIAGPDRAPNLILNGEGNVDPTSHGWSNTGGSWDETTPSGESEPVIRGQVLAAQGVQSTLIQDITTTAGKRYVIKFTTRNVDAPYQSVLIGTTASPSSIYSFGEIKSTSELNHEVVFVASETTTRITLVVDNTGVGGGSFTSYFDHIVVYDVDSENPAVQVQNLMRRHMPGINLDSTSFTEAEATYGDTFDRLAGVINQAEEQQSLLGRIAFQFRAKTFLDESGNQKWVVFDNSRNPTLNLGPDDIDKGSLQVSQEPTEKIFTSIFVYFDRDATVNNGDLGGREAYRGVLYATPEETNSIEDLELSLLCRQARDTFRIEKTLEIFADMIPDAATADKLLSYITRISVHRRTLVELTSYLNAVNLEIGDFVKLTHPLLPNFADNVNYEVIAKSVLPNGCLTAFTLAEVRQSAWNSWLETWEPVDLTVPVIIAEEDWEPPADPVPLADDTVFCNPLDEDWEPSVNLWEEKLTTWIAEDDYGQTPRDLTVSLSAAHNMDDFSTNPSPPSNFLPFSVSADAADQYGPYFTPHTAAINILPTSGPDGGPAIEFTNEPGNSPVVMYNGGPMFSTDVDWSINIWVYMYTKGSQHRPILINQEYDTLHEDSDGIPGDDNTRQAYILYYDYIADRFKFCVTNETNNTHSLQGDAWVATFPSGNIVTASTFGSPPLNTWSMITITADQSTDTLGISVNAGTEDTVVVGSGDLNPPISNGRQFITIHDRGGEILGGSTRHKFQGSTSLMGLNGRLTQAHYWGRLLTSGERTSLYNAGSSLPYPYV